MEFPDIKKDVKDAVLQARETGCRIRKRFNRTEFIKQFPKFGADPRVGFLPENFALDIEPMISIQCGELQDLCLANKGHPLALQKAFSIQGMPKDFSVTILREDYNILKQASTAPEVPAGKILVPAKVAKELKEEKKKK